MVHTQSNHKRADNRIPCSSNGVPCQRRYLCVLIGALSCLPATASAGEWTVTPSLSVSEILTDNVTLSETDKQSELITGVTPGLYIEGRGGRVSGVVNYTMQNLLYTNDSDRNSINHQLTASARAELTRNYLYLDGHSSISQQLIEPSQSVALDNISVGNRANVYTLGLKPYLLHNFGSAFTVYAGYGYDLVRYSDGAANSKIRTIDTSINSGRRFTRFIWGMNYHDQIVFRDGADDVKHKTARGDAQYRVTDYFRLLATVGYEKHDLQTTTAFNNGSYWAAGFGWTPSRYLDLSGLYGSRYKSASLSLTPSSRTALNVTWQDRSVGLNTGVTWLGSLHLRTRRSSWTASYSEDTTTVQQLALQGSALFYYDPLSGQVYPSGVDPNTGGTVPVDPVTGTPVPPSIANQLTPLPIDFYALTNEPFVQKRAQLVYGFHTARSNIGLLLFRTKRELLSNNSVTTDYGYNLSWDWRIGAFSRLGLAYNWQRYEYPSSQVDHLRRYTISVNRDINTKITSGVSYVRTERDSTSAGRQYTENRITARVIMQF